LRRARQQEQGQVPSRPGDPEDKRSRKQPVGLAQHRQGVAAPPDLLAQGAADQENDGEVDDHKGPARRRGIGWGLAAEEDVDARREYHDGGRTEERHGIPGRMDAPGNEATQQWAGPPVRRGVDQRDDARHRRA
jgi:hypothetical protein